VRAVVADEHAERARVGALRDRDLRGEAVVVHLDLLHRGCGGADDAAPGTTIAGGPIVGPRAGGGRAEGPDPLLSRPRGRRGGRAPPRTDRAGPPSRGRARPGPRSAPGRAPRAGHRAPRGTPASPPGARGRAPARRVSAAGSAAPRR